jgi:hypothetical protein
VAFRAELTVKTMFELTAVRNELFVSELVEPMRVPLKIANPPKMLPKIPPLPTIPAPSRLPESSSMFMPPAVHTLTGDNANLFRSQPCTRAIPVVSSLPRRC